MIRLPRIPLAQLPTPLEALARLSAHLGGPQLWVKRDDQTGLAFGGNKTRKLEYLAAAARAEKADLLITAGAVQSNHCRQTAAAAAHLGLDCILVLAGARPSRPSANILLNDLLGAQIVWTAREKRDETLKEEFERAVANGRNPYLVPYGGSSPLGAAAYAYAIEELMQQQEESFGAIVFASSSGGTQAGLVAGAALFGFKGQVMGISVDEPKSALQARIAALAAETAALLGKKISFNAEDNRVSDEYLGAGYAKMGEPELEAIHLFARHEGLLLDPVYTGRAAAGLIDLIRRGYFAEGQKVLFWHTGGTPAIFADAYRAALAGSL